MDKYKELTTAGREAYLNALDKIDWFKTSKSSREEVKQKIEEAHCLDWLLFSIEDVAFDAEGFEDYSSYESVIKDFLNVAGIDAELTVEQIEEPYGAKIGIKTLSNTYSYSVNIEELGDWMDLEMIDTFINNQVLAGENIEARFWELPPIDQGYRCVFAPPSIYQTAIAKGVIPEGDEGCFIMQELGLE